MQEKNHNLYWELKSEEYNSSTKISYNDYHYGPLVAGDSVFNLLPKNLKNLKCLELGCGAGHNSIYLANQGASCTAMDNSVKQLEYAKKIAKFAKGEIEIIKDDIENISKEKYGKFDIIHSSCAFSFIKNPEKIVAESAKMLNENGIFLFSMEHPLLSCESIELSDDEKGVFLENYFNLPPDIRYDDNNEILAEANYYSISTICNWFLSSNLKLENIIEPQAVNFYKIDKEAPYRSDAWKKLHPLLLKIPVVLILKWHHL